MKDDVKIEFNESHDRWEVVEDNEAIYYNQSKIKCVSWLERYKCMGKNFKQIPIYRFLSCDNRYVCGNITSLDPDGDVWVVCKKRNGVLLKAKLWLNSYPLVIVNNYNEILVNTINSLYEQKEKIDKDILELEKKLEFFKRERVI